jgi:hypothetical protein
MDDGEGKVVIVFILTMVTVLVSVIMAGTYYQSHCFVEDTALQDINTWLKECPELSKDIDELAKDGIITPNDYYKIKDKYKIIKVKRVE